MNQVIKHLLRWFIQGLVILIPLALTAGVIVYCYNLLNSYAFTEQPIISLGIILFTILILGFLFSTILGRALAILMERVLSQTPFIKLIYTSVKDLVEAFVGDKRRFNRPVLVTISREPFIQRPGFVTGDDLSALGIADKVSVYLPFSYSFSGQMVIVYRADVIPVPDVSAGDYMKFIVSGGVTDLEEEKEEEKEKIFQKPKSTKDQ